MKIKNLPSFPPNCNPYLEDAFHMGISLGSNVTAMLGNHSTDTCDYIILVDTRTGERIQIDFTDAADDKANLAKVTDRILKYGKISGEDN